MGGWVWVVYVGGGGAEGFKTPLGHSLIHINPPHRPPAALFRPFPQAVADIFQARRADPSAPAPALAAAAGGGGGLSERSGLPGVERLVSAVQQLGLPTDSDGLNRLAARAAELGPGASASAARFGSILVRRAAGRLQERLDRLGPAVPGPTRQASEAFLQVRGRREKRAGKGGDGRKEGGEESRERGRREKKKGTKSKEMGRRERGIREQDGVRRRNGASRRGTCHDGTDCRGLAAVRVRVAGRRSPSVESQRIAGRGVTRRDRAGRGTA